MKFNVGLSAEDIKSQAKLLEELFTTVEDNVRIIRSDIVQKCIDIFVNTFRDEICPRCGEGLLRANHLSYYNIIVKTCDACDHKTMLRRE